MLSNSPVDLTNELVLQDKYYFYLQNVCSGSRVASDRRNASKIGVEKCRGWGEIRKGETENILAGSHADEARHNRLKQGL